MQPRCYPESSAVRRVPAADAQELLGEPCQVEWILCQEKTHWPAWEGIWCHWIEGAFCLLSRLNYQAMLVALNGPLLCSTIAQA